MPSMWLYKHSTPMSPLTMKEVNAVHESSGEKDAISPVYLHAKPTICRIDGPPSTTSP